MENPDLIDRYLFGHLSSEEEKEILLRRDVDLTFARALKERKSIFLGLQALGNEQMKTKIKAVRQRMFEEERNKAFQNKPRPKSNRRSWMVMAAAIVLLLFLAWQFLF